jgi:hypothetical protein
MESFKKKKERKEAGRREKGFLERALQIKK